MKRLFFFVILAILFVNANVFAGSLADEVKYFPEKNDIYFYTDFASISGFMKNNGISPEDSMLIFGDKAAQSIEPFLSSFKIGIEDIQEILISGQTEEIEKNSAVLTLVRIGRKADIPKEMISGGIPHENFMLYKIENSKDLYITLVDNILVTGFKPLLMSYLSDRNAKRATDSFTVRTFSTNSRDKTIYFLVTVSKFLKEKMDSSIKKGSAYGKGLNENVFIRSLISLNSVEGGLTLGKHIDLFAGLQSSSPEDGERLLMVSHFLIVGSSLAISFMDAWSKSLGGKAAKPSTSDEEMSRIQAMFGRIRTKQISNGVMMSFAMNPEESTAFVKKIQGSIQTAKADRKTRIEKERIAGLVQAIRLGDINKVRTLASEGVTINGLDPSGISPLTAASESGKLDIVTLLLQQGADANVRSGHGITALHKAAESGHLDIVKILIEKGADINAEDENGERAYDKARNNNQTQVTDFFEKNYNMRTPKEDENDSNDTTE